MINEKACIAEREPEFASLLKELSKQNAICRELTDRIGFYSKNLCEINQVQKEQVKDLTPISTGVLGALWEQVYYLKRSNEELEAISNHLQSVIGS